MSVILSDEDIFDECDLASVLLEALEQERQKASQGAVANLENESEQS